MKADEAIKLIKHYYDVVKLRFRRESIEKVLIRCGATHRRTETRKQSFELQRKLERYEVIWLEEPFIRTI